MWSRDESTANVAEVPDAQALWRLLVTEPSGPALPPEVAVDTFRRLHDAGQPAPFDSALLLCTDWRWRRAGVRVPAGIAATGILGEAEEDRLAEELLWSDTVRYVLPADLMGGVLVEVDLGEPGERRPPRQVRADPATPFTTERRVWPPLRTWAAERVLVRERAIPGDVMERARALPARHGSAVAAGAVRATGALGPEQAREVVETALRWPSKPARMAALERLTEWGESGRARALALADPDATIQAWGRRSAEDVPVQGGLFD
ncbi:hypothetical protein [Actinophytocola glycyrrhizae]|uniref:HEAT repeat protein n=1 Tax=Actinophytocola glycyrrhizae TaxID=2044873 RepID=A0ABV9RYZ9_9PSEU